MRIMKLTQLTDFKRILESKVDINLKIAKILTNALNWKIDFSAFKGSKYSFYFPFNGESLIKDYLHEESKTPKVPTNYNKFKVIDVDDVP